MSVQLVALGADWKSTKWSTSDSARLREIRLDVSTQLGRAKDKLEVMGKLERAAFGDKASYEDKFRYVSCLVGLLFSDGFGLNKCKSAIALIGAKSPLPVESARLLLYLESKITPDIRLQATAKKLLEFYPNDDFVVSMVIRQLSYSPDVSDRRKAVKLASDLKVKLKESVESLYKYAVTCWLLFWLSKEEGDKQLTVGAFKKVKLKAGTSEQFAKYRESSDRYLKGLVGGQVQNANQPQQKYLGF